MSCRYFCYVIFQVVPLFLKLTKFFSLILSALKKSFKIFKKIFCLFDFFLYLCITNLKTTKTKNRPFLGQKKIKKMKKEKISEASEKNTEKVATAYLNSEFAEFGVKSIKDALNQRFRGLNHVATFVANSLKHKSLWTKEFREFTDTFNKAYIYGEVVKWHKINGLVNEEGKLCRWSQRRQTDAAGTVIYLPAQLVERKAFTVSVVVDALAGKVVVKPSKRAVNE